MTITLRANQIIVDLDNAEFGVALKAIGLRRVLEQWLLEQEASLDDQDRQAIGIALAKADAVTISSVKTVLGV